MGVNKQSDKMGEPIKWNIVLRVKPLMQLINRKPIHNRFLRLMCQFDKLVKIHKKWLMVRQFNTP